VSDDALLPSEPVLDLAVLRKDADAAIAAARALLDAPVFAKQIPLALLTKFASDEKLPARERLRAIVALANLQVRGVEVLASLSGAREQRLKELGVESGPQEVHVEQHNTKIEIVREGARDWRRIEAP
jgi:hypothetical protein